MAKAKNTDGKITSKPKPSDIDVVRTRINELYVILEGMSSRLDEIEKTANKSAQRLGI